MSKPPLWRTPHIFDDPADAVEYYNSHRAEPDSMALMPEAILDFLLYVQDYDDRAVYNVQPAFRSHYIAAANPDDHHVWLYAKPNGVSFALGDERNVAAVLSMWGDPDHVPQKILPTDVWFDVSELESAAVEFCVRLSAEWAAWRSGNG